MTIHSKAFLLLLFPTLVLPAVAQSTQTRSTPAISFEVVSVKQNISGSRQMARQSSGNSDEVTMTNVPAFLMVFYAYGINDENLVIGLPDWAMADRYDLTAKVAASDVPAYQSLTARQRAAMLQKVLEERFHLQAHRETRQRQVYALTVAKGGPKLKPAHPIDPGAASSKPESGFAHGATIIPSGPGQFTAHAATMSDLATLFSNIGTHTLGRPVVDHTGLAGKFDFTLQLPVAQPSADTDADNQPEPGALFTAIQRQLGLKLQSTTAPTEYLVIDHMESPHPELVLHLQLRTLVSTRRHHLHAKGPLLRGFPHRPEVQLHHQPHRHSCRN